MFMFSKQELRGIKRHFKNLLSFMMNLIVHACFSMLFNKVKETSLVFCLERILFQGQTYLLQVILR